MFLFCFAENGGFDRSEQRAVIIGLCIVGVLLLVLIIPAIVILRHWMMKNSPNLSEINVESSAANHWTGTEKPSADDQECSTKSLLKADPRKDG